MINLFHVSFDDDVKKKVIETLDSAAIAAGDNVLALENSISSLYSGMYALTVSDMTNGIMLILDVFGLKKGDEILVSPFSCLATTSPIPLFGIKPVWIDLDPSTMSIDLESLKNSITPRTKAILVYHVAGYPSNMIEISKIAKDNNLLVIEDCNAAFGSKYQNKPLGSWSDATVLSFYPNRQVGAMDGGCVLFREHAHFELAKRRRRYGVDFNGFRKSNGEINELKDVTTYGYSLTMNNVSSAIVCSKLKNIEVDKSKTKINVARIDNIVSSLQYKYTQTIDRISPIDGADVNNWVYFLKINEKERFIMKMKENGVHVSSLHLRNDLYSCFQTEKKNLPGIDIVSNSVVAIPCGYWLSPDDIKVIEKVLGETVPTLVLS